MTTDAKPFDRKSRNAESDTIRVVRPSLKFVVSYQDALQRGWSPNNVTAERTRLEELEKIAKDPQAFVDSLVDIEAKQLGLSHVYITTQPDNVASRKVIEANRGRFLETFIKDAGYGGHEGSKFKVDLV